MHFIGVKQKQGFLAKVSQSQATWDFLIENLLMIILINQTQLCYLHRFSGALPRTHNDETHQIE